MTETLSRPSAPPSPAHDGERRRRRTAVAGALAALAAAAAGLLLVALPVVLAWADDARGAAPASAAARTAGQLWLLAHGAVLEVPGGRVSLLPLGLALLPLLLLLSGGSWVSRRRAAASGRAAAACALAVAVPYAALAGGVAALAATPEVRPSVPSAVLAGLGLGLLGAGGGALRPHRLWRLVWLRLPASARRTLPAALAASGSVLGAGALLVGGSLVAHLGRAADLARAGDPGAVGGAALLLLEAALAPNAAVWGTSWLAGPGFAVGAGTAVGPFDHVLGAVPALPLLAALPAAAAPTWLAALALAVPVAAGAVAGRLLLAAAPEAPLRRTVLDVVRTAVLTGLTWAALAALSGGAAGGQRLAELGPSPARTGLALAVEVGAGALAALLVLRRRSG